MTILQCQDGQMPECDPMLNGCDAAEPRAAGIRIDKTTDWPTKRWIFEIFIGMIQAVVTSVATSSKSARI